MPHASSRSCVLIFMVVMVRSRTDVQLFCKDPAGLPPAARSLFPRGQARIAWLRAVPCTRQAPRYLLSGRVLRIDPDALAFPPNPG